MQPKEKTNVIDQETTTSLITRDEVVRYDFQGWPEYQIRVIDLLKVLNIPTDNISKDILEKHIEEIITLGEVPKFLNMNKEEFSKKF